MLLLGFVDPNGRYYNCEKFGHEELANELLVRFYGYRQYKANPIEDLCEHGWVVIQSSYVGFISVNLCKLSFTKNQEIFFEDNYDKLTYDQIMGLEEAYEINQLSRLRRYYQ